jgi:hypothetical protein
LLQYAEYARKYVEYDKTYAEQYAKYDKNNLQILQHILHDILHIAICPACPI